MEGRIFGCFHILHDVFSAMFKYSSEACITFIIGNGMKSFLKKKTKNFITDITKMCKIMYIQGYSSLLCLPSSQSREAK